MENIFDTEQGERLECVLVEGAPGSGKTTFAWEVSQQWAKGLLFQQYQILILLRLRDQNVQTAKTFKDIILYQDETCQQEIAKHITCSAGNNTLIILEGLDELPQHLITTPSIFTALLSGTLVPRATIMITSRPLITGQLYRQWKRRISRHIEILGFTEENIDKYIRSVLDGDELPHFNAYISTTPSIRRLMYIPLHSVIVIEMYRTCVCSSKPLPTSLTSLYKALAQTILHRYLCIHPDYKDDEKYKSIDEFKDLPPEVYSDFYNLAEMAYNRVREQVLVFKDQAANNLGFLNTMPELFITTRDANYSCNFLHLSVQEFMAAYYISQKDTCEQEKLLESIYTEKHLQNTGRFLAGLTKFHGFDNDVVKQAIEKECEKYGDGTIILSMYALTLIYETESASVLDGHSCYMYHLSDYNPLFEFSALGYSISHSNYRWKLLLGSLPSRPMQSTEGVHLLIRALTNHSNCNYVIESIACYYEEMQCIQLLLTGLPRHVLQNVEHLELWSKIRQPLAQCVPGLIPTLIKLSTLQLLGVAGPTLTETVQALARADTLKKLTMGDRETVEYVTPLAQWLSSSKQLETLVITSLSPSGIEILSTATPSSLKALTLQWSQFSLPAMRVFSAMLGRSTSVSKVALEWCVISEEARKTLEGVKKVNKCMEISY